MKHSFKSRSDLREACALDHKAILPLTEVYSNMYHMRQTIASPPPWPECREDRKRLRKRFEEKVQFDLGPEGQVGKTDEGFQV